MISEYDKTVICEIAAKYRAKIILFGSSLSPTVEARDIDIAVSGIADEDFFSFYGELMRRLSKPVDVVDLSKQSKFVDLVLREGVILNA